MPLWEGEGAAGRDPPFPGGCLGWSAAAFPGPSGGDAVLSDASAAGRRGRVHASPPLPPPPAQPPSFRLGHSPPVAPVPGRCRAPAGPPAPAPFAHGLRPLGVTGGGGATHPHPHSPETHSAGYARVGSRYSPYPATATASRLACLVRAAAPPPDTTQPVPRPTSRSATYPPIQRPHPFAPWGRPARVRHSAGRVAVQVTGVESLLSALEACGVDNARWGRGMSCV